MSAHDPVTIRTPRRDYTYSTRPSVLIECDGGEVPELHRPVCRARLDVTAPTKQAARRVMRRAGWRRYVNGDVTVDLCSACARSLHVDVR